MNKNKLIRELNDAFIEILSKVKHNEYVKYVRDINKDLLANVDKLDVAKVKSIVESYSVNVKDTAFLFMILSAVTMIVNKKRMTKKEKLPLAPILGVLGIYSLKNPKRFVEKIYHINKGVGLNDNEKKAKVYFKTYEMHNEKTLNKTVIETQRHMTISQRKAATQIGRNMVNDLKQMRKENISIKKMQRVLRSKYTKVQVDSMINTELHSQAELSKIIHAKETGFTHKTWKQLSRPTKRKTKYHTHVVNKRIPIDSKFKNGSIKADRPGDESLPPGERIRCGCWLVYD